LTAEVQAQQTGHPRRWAILPVLVVSLLVVVLDNTVLNVALKTIQDDLGASQSELEWSINSYTLVFAGLLFTFGLLGDRFGRKRVLLAGLILFGLSSALSAYAQTPGQLIGARAIMGVGGAAIMPVTLAIIQNIFPPNERGRAIGIWAGAVGIGVVLGPVLGGGLLDHFWWGSVFLINVPVVAIGAALVAAIVPETRNPNPGRLDPTGVLLSIAGLVLLVYGIIKGGELGTVADVAVLGPALAGLALLAFFVWYEWRSDHPALDVRLFQNRQASVSVAALSLIFFAMMGSLFFMTFYLQSVRGYSPFEAGLWFLPFAAGQMVFAPLSARLVNQFGIRAVSTFGLALLTLSLAAFLLMDVDSPMWYFGLVGVIQGAGAGSVMPPATTAILAALPRERAGVGSAVQNTMRQVGGALGVAILGSVLAAQYRDQITPHLSALPDQAQQAAGESIGATLGAAAQAGPQAVAQIQGPAFDAFIHAMHVTVSVASVVALAATMLAFRFLPSMRPAQAAPAEVSAEQRQEAVEAVPGG
jgi:MFS transporter, DHA2 family, multidrug resistance protein